MRRNLNLAFRFLDLSVASVAQQLILLDPRKFAASHAAINELLLGAEANPKKTRCLAGQTLRFANIDAGGDGKISLKLVRPLDVQYI